MRWLQPLELNATTCMIHATSPIQSAQIHTYMRIRIGAYYDDMPARFAYTRIIFIALLINSCAVCNQFLHPLPMFTRARNILNASVHIIFSRAPPSNHPWWSISIYVYIKCVQHCIRVVSTHALHTQLYYAILYTNTALRTRLTYIAVVHQMRLLGTFHINNCYIINI